MNIAPFPPGEVHPAYAGSWLVEWVDSPNGQWCVVVPHRIGTPGFGLRTVTLRQAYGPAPYVGRPYVYTWNLGEDELGRMVGGTRVRVEYAETADQ